jgi:selenocysteine-specific elongation factor
LDLPDRRLVLALAKPPFRVACGALHIARPAGQDAGPDLPEAVLGAVRVLRADLATAPFLSPDAERLRKLGLDTRSIAAAVRAGQLMRISDQVVLAPGADALASEVLARLPQPFTAAQAREALGTTRRTAIPLLEYLDSAGITKRLLDDRRVMLARPATPAGPAGNGTAPAGNDATSAAIAGVATAGHARAAGDGSPAEDGSAARDGSAGAGGGGAANPATASSGR